MGECICPWEATIKKNQSLLTGNGGKGLVREMEEMKGEMKHMNQNYTELSRSYGILAKSLQDVDVKEKVKIELKKRRSELTKRMVTIVTIIGGVLAAIYLVLDHI